MSIISRWELQLFLFFFQCFEAFTGTETIIRTSLFTQLAKSWCINIEALALCIWPIPAVMMRALIWHNIELSVSLEYTLDGTLDETSTIGILYTEDIFTTIMSRPEITVQHSTE
jgi:hypothetical protein